MRTSTPLVYASPPSARRSPLKRRRLNHAVDTGYQPSRALTDNSNVAPTLNAHAHASSLSLCAKFSCSACHRALSTAIRPGIAGPCVCSRCAAPTCAICARTCTSYTCPPSIPPTPALTRSPSPTTQATTPVTLSPKRAALGLSYSAMNCDACAALALPPPLPSTKRKKAPIDKEDIDGDGNGDRGSSAECGHCNVDTDTDAASARSGAGSTVVPGCGRVVCRACCVESVANDGTLCVDCYALV